MQSESVPMIDAREQTSTSILPPILLAVAAASLSMAAHADEGRISPPAIAWLTLACVSAVLALLSFFVRGARDNSATTLGAVMMACLAAQFAAIVWSPIELRPGTSAQHVRALMMTLGASAVLAGSLCASRSWLGRIAFPLLLVAQLVMGLLLVKGFSIPGIDVLMFQHASCGAILEGTNPYAIRFPDPYPPASSAAFYGPGVSVNGVLQFGYPYMPITLFMALPGYLLGDVRYAGLACVVIAAALIGYARRDPTSKVAAALLMFSPIAPLVLYLAWTEAYVVLLLALVYFLYHRKPSLLPFAFGLLLVSKQYMLAMAPLGLLLLPRPWNLHQIMRFGIKAAIPAAIVTLPLALWDVKEFLHSAITLQTRQPYRLDALSFLVWSQPANPARWMWLPFAGLGLMLLVSCLAGMRRRIPFALGLALCLFAFFAVNKQAFANYYYLVIASLCCAVASASPEEERPIAP